jgi:hypothetical protein
MVGFFLIPKLLKSFVQNGVGWGMMYGARAKAPAKCFFVTKNGAE